MVLETLLGFKRAGADLILTYHAKDAARWLPRARPTRPCSAGYLLLRGVVAHNSERHVLHG